MTFEQKKELETAIAILGKFIDDPTVPDLEAWDLIDCISKLQSLAKITKEEYKEHFKKQRDLAA